VKDDRQDGQKRHQYPRRDDWNDQELWQGSANRNGYIVGYTTTDQSWNVSNPETMQRWVLDGFTIGDLGEIIENWHIKLITMRIEWNIMGCTVYVYLYVSLFVHI